MDTVYVADWYGARVLALEAESGRITGTVETGLSPSGLAVTPDGRLLLSADRDSNAVSIIDTAKPDAGSAR